LIHASQREADAVHSSSPSVQEALPGPGPQRTLDRHLGTTERPAAAQAAGPILDDLSTELRADVVVLAFVLAHGEEHLEEVIRSLRLRGISADVVAGGAAEHVAPQPTADSLLPPAEIYSDALLTVDFRLRRVELGGRELALTPLEFRLLVAFVRNAKQVLPHEQLVELAWGDSRSVSREQLRLTVSYLRRKLGIEGRGAIETVRGFGYRYRPGG
jgi:hypothetical protein